MVNSSEFGRGRGDAFEKDIMISVEWYWWWWWWWWWYLKPHNMTPDIWKVHLYTFVIFIVWNSTFLPPLVRPPNGVLCWTIWIYLSPLGAVVWKSMARSPLETWENSMGFVSSENFPVVFFTGLVVFTTWKLWCGNTLLAFWRFSAWKGFRFVFKVSSGFMWNFEGVPLFFGMKGPPKCTVTSLFSGDWGKMDKDEKIIQEYQTLIFWSNYRDLTRPGPPKGSFLEGKWDPGYFREI